jgi:hypothetical protein
LGTQTGLLFQNFFYFSGATLYFHKVVDVTTSTGTFATPPTTPTTFVFLSNTVTFSNFTVAHLSGINGVGTNATQIDASDIILF